MFAHQRDYQMSLEGMCRYLLQDGKKMSKQSLQDRFTDEAADFMQKMVSHALTERLHRSPSAHEKFNRIIIGDSTVFQLPPQFSDVYRGSGGGASTAAIKVQYNYDLLTGSIITLLNREGASADGSTPVPALKKDDLLIEDLGYFNIGRFKAIEKQSACFLSRLRFGIRVYVKKGPRYEVLDLLKEEKKMKPGQMCQYEAYIGEKEKLPVRLVIEKVPEQVAEQKRRKLKTDKQSKRKGLSDARLSFCILNAYITNASQEDLPMHQVRSYYSLRWQIEILFKAWKSVYKLNQVKPMKCQRFQCIHYGLLMLIILTTHLLVCFKKIVRKLDGNELSEFKLYKCLKEILPVWSDAVKKKRNLSDVIESIIGMVRNTCIKDQKKNKRTPFAILYQTP